MTEILDIVNENDEVIGQIDRNQKDDSHIVRIIFIGFYTPDKKLIMQKRSMQKKKSPGKMTATVSGHVESGMSYDDTVIKEALEESGISINPNRVVYLGKFLEQGTMRAVYAYPFDGSINDLKIEAGEGDGFVAMTIPELRQKRQAHPDEFTPFVSSQSGSALFDYIEQVQNH